MLDGQGNIYGTTSRGGCNPSGYGTVFQIGTAANETVLYSFNGGSDGCYPYLGKKVASVTILPPGEYLRMRARST